MSSILDDVRFAFRMRSNMHLKLIIINVAVFIFINILLVTTYLLNLVSVYELFANQLELPAAFGKLIYRPFTLLTYAFHHANILHIAFNMLALYWFGEILQDYIGSKRLLSTYILSALAGGILFVLLYNFAPVKMWNKDVGVVELLGASGAVYGVLMAVATVSGSHTIFLFLIGPVQVKYIAWFYVLVSYLALLSQNAGGNMAHLGGAFMGYFYIYQLRNGRDFGVWIHRFLSWLNGLFVRKPKVRVAYKATKVAQKVTINNPPQGNTPPQKVAQQIGANKYRPTQQEIDDILDKISESGYDSLSKEDKLKLSQVGED